MVVAASNSNEAATVVGLSASSGRIATRLYKLAHASATEVAAKFNEMWNGEFGQIWKVSRMAVAFEESNAVMVTAPEPILDACSKAIAELDVEAKQVYIEARFIELSTSAMHKLGIDWKMLENMQGSLSLAGGFDRRDLPSDTSSGYETVSGRDEYQHTRYTATGSKANMGYFSGTLSFSEMALVLSALERNNDVKTFSNPKIIVSSGKKALVDMTQKYPNVAISAKRTLNGNAESLDLDMKMIEIPGEDKMMFAREAFFSWGISLEVTPRIGTGGLINVSIVPTISDCTEFVSAGSANAESTAGYSSRYPIINVQRLVTEFNMASGTTAVIGGLARTIEEQVDSGIPYLRRIPWLGRVLFGGKSRQKVQKEIIVFVTVGLVDPLNMSRDAGLPKNAVIGRTYVEGVRHEPGDRAPITGGTFDLDLRALETQAADPLGTNTTATTRAPTNLESPKSTQILDVETNKNQNKMEVK